MLACAWNPPVTVRPPTLNVRILGHEQEPPPQRGRGGVSSSTKEIQHGRHQVVVMEELVGPRFLPGDIFRAFPLKGEASEVLEKLLLAPSSRRATPEQKVPHQEAGGGLVESRAGPRSLRYTGHSQL